MQKPTATTDDERVTIIDWWVASVALPLSLYINILRFTYNYPEDQKLRCYSDIRLVFYFIISIDFMDLRRYSYSMLWTTATRERQTETDGQAVQRRMRRPSLPDE